MSKLLKELGFSHMSPAAPSGAGCPIVEEFKKLSRTLDAHLADLPKGKPVDVCFQDEARIGQKNGVVRQWARRGTGPGSPPTSAIKAHTCSAPSARRAAREQPWRCRLPTPRPCSFTSTRSAATWARGAQAVLLLDRAGWHTTAKLKVPKNITPVLLPSRAPELNPVENVWQYPRQGSPTAFSTATTP
ncbi:transposase [Mesorhizobium sp. L-2-11]|uniref:transposase n=1 Tax=Mesorhizobium sp. L-2-11 TaxID=2744521 RepID=UPI001FD3F838|nr:transposase [Mesorhizobium sp. L-2-11]